jgi:hypothetical protein
MARQEHDRQTGDLSGDQGGGRYAPGAANGLALRARKSRQIIDAGAADNTQNRFCHGPRRCYCSALGGLAPCCKGGKGSLPEASLKDNRVSGTTTDLVRRGRQVGESLDVGAADDSQNWRCHSHFAACEIPDTTR